MSQNIGVWQVQDKAVALNRVANVLWRFSHLSRAYKGNRTLISMEDLQSAYASTYPAADQRELHRGLEALLNLGEVEKVADDILFDLSRLK